MRLSASDLDRVFRRIEPEPMSGCWLWAGTTNQSGYGMVSIGGKNRQCHRVLYEQLVGPVPAGLQLDHKCRVRCCANPAHLRPVTGRENTMAPGSLSWPNLNRAKTTCKRGHPFDAANTYRTPRGGRECLTCIRAYRLKIYAEKGEEIRARARAYYYANREHVIARIVAYKRRGRAWPDLYA